MKQRMLITGVSGLLGNNLAHYFRNQYDILGLYFSHSIRLNRIRTKKFDLTRLDKIAEFINKFDPKIIIHCASLTDIDQCENNKKLAETINSYSTKEIVDVVNKKSIQLVYISTDAVYDGEKGNFSEEDEVCPQNYYGKTKLMGEKEALKNKNALILRTNIFGWNVQNKKSLGEWIIDKLNNNQKIQGFEDAYFSTIYTFELARIIDIALKKKISGVFNCGSSNVLSKFEFATKIARWFNLSPNLIYPISIEKFPFKAKRGKKLSLNIKKLQKALDYKLPRIEYSIEQFYRDFQLRLPKEIKGKKLNFYKSSDFIPYGKQSIDDNDVESVIEVLSSEKITQGPKIDIFEEALSNYCNANYAVATNSGTSSLHTSCLAGEIGPGDEVITSPITFVASANCALFCGATPIFADIDPETYNISPDEIAKKITPKTRAIIPVHLAGQSCDMEKIYNIARSAEKKFGHKILIIEDASHALGSRYKGNKVGSCEFSDMAVMSFHPVKHITTGEGGAIITNDKRYYQRSKLFSNHGILRKNNINNSYSEKWLYEQIELGYNFRITDIQCALGISQLKKLDKFAKNRLKIVKKYNKIFGNLRNVKIPFEAKNCNSNFHLYILLFEFKKIGISRSELMERLIEKGVLTQVHYIPVHTQPFYQKKFNLGWGDFINAENYYKKCLSIPLFPSMTDNEIEKVSKTIEESII